MTTEELIDFIQKSRLFGRTDSQIRSMLSEKGWTQEDIEAGLLKADFSPQPSQSPPPSSGKNLTTVLIVVIVTVVLTSLFGVGGYFAYQRFLKQEAPKVEESAPTTEKDIRAEEQRKYLAFAESLRTCTKYQDTFRHFFTGGMMNREILGIIDGKCRYIEEMPNDGQMECNYSEEDRLIAAAAHKEFAETGSARAEIGGTTATGESQAESTIGNERRENPLQEFLDNGVCVISGYDL